MPCRAARALALAAAVLAMGCGPVAASGLGSSALGPSTRSSHAGTPKQREPPPPWSSVAAPSAGDRVLAVAIRMVDDDTVVRGSCYSYISAVFEDAGYPSSSRERVFRGRVAGPYADLSLILPGDWLAIINHPERDPMGTHSVIFVRWSDRAGGVADVVSYAGGDQDRPGDIVPYDITRTYRISRAVDAP